MKNALIIPEEVIVQKIYTFRNKNVMIDSDLAELYGVETRVMNQQISRNEDRFPHDFMFQLNQKEFARLQALRTSNSRGGRRSLPYVFTEHGVLMLSGILNSDKAVAINIQLVRIFTKMREMILNNKEIVAELEQLRFKINGQDERIDHLQAYLLQFVEDKSKPRKAIGFKRQNE